MPTNDFIPAGEDTGAYGNGSFSDFVPAKEPVKKELPKEQPVVEEVIVEDVPQKPQVRK